MLILTVPHGCDLMGSDASVLFINWFVISLITKNNLLCKSFESLEAVIFHCMVHLLYDLLDPCQ